MQYQLSTGICKTLFTQDVTEEYWYGVIDEPCTVQILSIKKVETADPTRQNSSTDKYRVMISDSVHIVQAMLHDSLKDMVTDDLIRRNTIVVLDNVTSAFLRGQRLILIHDLHVVAQETQRIGTPKKLPANSSEASGIAREARLSLSTTTALPIASSSSQIGGHDDPPLSSISWSSTSVSTATPPLPRLSRPLTKSQSLSSATTAYSSSSVIDHPVVSPRRNSGWMPTFSSSSSAIDPVISPRRNTGFTPTTPPSSSAIDRPVISPRGNTGFTPTVSSSSAIDPVITPLRNTGFTPTTPPSSSAIDPVISPRRNTGSSPTISSSSPAIDQSVISPRGHSRSTPAFSPSSSAIDPVISPHRNTGSIPTISSSSSTIDHPDNSPRRDTGLSPISSSSSQTARQPPSNNVQESPTKSSQASSICSIAALNRYKRNWTIRALIAHKSDVTPWSNASRAGKLFHLNLKDESGEIKAVVFNNVEELHPKLETGKVYYISGALVKDANKKYSPKHDFELSITSHTKIEPCHDSDAPALQYQFVPIAELDNLPKGSLCDVIGVVKEVGQLHEFSGRNSARKYKKRLLTLVDKSRGSVQVTLWDGIAEAYKADDDAVVAFRAVKVGDFGGTSLSMLKSSSMTIDPGIPEAFDLRGWYDSFGSEQTFRARSSKSGANSGDPGKSMTLKDVHEVMYACSEKEQRFSAEATVTFIRQDDMTYPGCPQCKKKLIEQDQDSWCCPKCGNNLPQPSYLYRFVVDVVDWTGQARFQAFNDIGEVLLGMKANELMKHKNDEPPQFDSIISAAESRSYRFICRAIKDDYDNRNITRYVIVHAIPLDYKDESLRLCNLLRSNWALNL